MENKNIFDGDIRGTVKKELPFLPGAFVMFYDDVTTGEIRKAQKASQDKDMDSSLELLLSQIADWNFSDKDGKLPITIESIDRLPLKIVTWISQSESEILASVQDKKKELPNN